jgi:hypothetical protein
MGRQYAQQLRDLCSELGGPGLTVFVNRDGLHPHYYIHVVDVLRDSGCRLVDDRAEAAAVIEGYTQPPSLAPGQICITLEDGRLVALGAPNTLPVPS